jgi:flavin reductase (DIM6/NTAB) family NADH-FMN oxidoreductase RutF
MAGGAFDSQLFRRACGQFLTGVTVVTTMTEHAGPVGLTVNSFASVSLNPPLVLVCLDRHIGSYPAFHTGGQVAIQVLAEDQAALSTRFATRGLDKFADVTWSVGELGTPILAGCVALFECAVERAVDAGDHTIFVARVERLDIGRPATPPLGFFRGRYVEVRTPLYGPAAHQEAPGIDAVWSLGWA